jgi:N-dimethylarginine dimethylaminohydrolase
MRAYVDSEFGRLRSVLLCSVENFKLHPPINVTQRHYYQTDPPKLDILQAQQAAFVRALEDHQVDIKWAAPQSESPVQINTRDVATVIGDTLLVCSMKEPLRQREPDALNDLLTELESPVMRVGTGVVEGGDIILDGDTLYAGLSERTDTAGLDWLRSHFGDRFHVQALRLLPPFLHLDVVFNLVGNDAALIYPPALQPEDLDLLRGRYTLIEVTESEQFALATNVFSLSPDVVISERENTRVNPLLRALGKTVVEVPYSEVIKIGGSFRCSTCPLIRDPV